MKTIPPSGKWGIWKIERLSGMIRLKDLKIIRHAVHLQWLATHTGHSSCSPKMASQAKYKVFVILALFGVPCAHLPNSWLRGAGRLPGDSEQGGSSMGSLCTGSGSCHISQSWVGDLCLSTLRPREASLFFQLCLYWITQLIASDEAVIFWCLSKLLTLSF